MGNWQRRKHRLLAKLFTRFRWLTTLWLRGHTFTKLGPPPWTPLPKPLSTCTVALVTTAGVHRRDDQPFDMTDPDGDPSYREIPGDWPLEELTITHDYYDHSDADKDLNIVFPLQRLQEFQAEGRIGRLAPVHYSFMGHIDKHHLPVLLYETAPEVATKLKEQKVDVVLLTPA
ncbi:MAG: hypothetical protein D6736_01505 [Nitrospinota bacterium]|nr:MAG: hypothetical protein D6736_01505 [Nitrospinota bacterium]